MAVNLHTHTHKKCQHIIKNKFMILSRTTTVNGTQWDDR